MSPTRHGRIDILHNHAGVQVAGSVEEVDIAGFDRSWAVNVHAQFVACQAVLPVMKKQRRGVILNTSSNSGVFLDRAMTAYITSKAASITMTRQIALDVARYGIRINALCPGWVDTPFNDPYTEQLGGRKALEHAIANIVPMGRFATRRGDRRGDPVHGVRPLLLHDGPRLGCRWRRVAGGRHERRKRRHLTNCHGGSGLSLSIQVLTRPFRLLEWY